MAQEAPDFMMAAYSGDIPDDAFTWTPVYDDYGNVIGDMGPDTDGTAVDTPPDYTDYTGFVINGPKSADFDATLYDSASLFDNHVSFDKINDENGLLYRFTYDVKGDASDLWVFSMQDGQFDVTHNGNPIAFTDIL